MLDLNTASIPEPHTQPSANIPQEDYKNMKTYGESKQSIEEIQAIIAQARTRPRVPTMMDEDVGDDTAFDDTDWMQGSGANYMVDDPQ